MIHDLLAAVMLPLGQPASQLVVKQSGSLVERDVPVFPLCSLAAERLQVSVLGLRLGLSGGGLLGGGGFTFEWAVFGR